MISAAIVDPETNPASPKDLGPLFSDLVNAALVAQARALAVERQVALQVVFDPSGLAAEASAAQSDIRRSAGFQLNRGAQEVSRALAGGDSGVNLMRVLATRLASAGDPAAMIGVVAQSIDRVYLDARDFADEAARIARGSRAASGRFEEALILATGRIASEGGGAVGIRAEIDALEAAIDRNLSELVEGSALIGEGGRRFVSGALTTITNLAGATSDARAVDAARTERAARAAQANAAPTPLPTDDEIRKKEAAERERFAVKDFPIESVDVVSRGAVGVGAAMAAFTANRKRLAELLHQLASIDGLLAATSGLGSQASGFTRAAEEIAVAADALATSWGRLVGDLRTLATEVARTDPGSPERAHVLCKIAAAAPLWTRFGERLRRLEGSLVGADDSVLGLSEAARA